MKRYASWLFTAILLLILFIPTASASGSADLTVTALDWQGGDGQVTAGTPLTFSVTIKNVGSADVTVPFAVDVSFGKTLIQRVQQNGLAAGASVTVKTAPWKAVLGDKMIAVRVNADNAVAESEKRNNTRQSNLRVASDRLTPACNADDVSDAGMFDLTFSDDFNDLTTVDKLATGREGYKWYVKRRYAQSDMVPGDYFVSNGVLTLQYTDDRYTIGASTVDCESHAGYTFNKGYLEARVRMPHASNTSGESAKTAMWSLPIESWAEGLSIDHYVEADWFEYYSYGKFGMTLHDLEGPQGNRNWMATTHSGIHGLDDEQWHVMGWLWEDNRLRCYLDGNLYYEQTWGENDIPLPVPAYKSGELKFEGVFEVMDSQNMMLFIAGSNKMPLQLDYVRIWEKGGTPTTKPTTKPTTTTKAPTATTKKPTVTTTTAAVTTTTATSTAANTSVTTAVSTTATTAATTAAPSATVVPDVVTTTTTATTVQSTTPSETVTSVDTDTTASSESVTEPTETIATTTADTQAPTPQQTSKTSGWLVGGIVFLALAALGGAVVGIVLSRKKH